MKEHPLEPSMNVLADIHLQLSDFSIAFREHLCEECAWSIPTFYRKMRCVDKLSEAKQLKVIPALSNAEKDKIIAVLDERFNTLKKYLEKYKNPPGK